jgi:hypothetical protein
MTENNSDTHTYSHNGLGQALTRATQHSVSMFHLCRRRGGKTYKQTRQTDRPDRQKQTDRQRQTDRPDRQIYQTEGDRQIDHTHRPQTDKTDRQDRKRQTDRQTQTDRPDP